MKIKNSQDKRFNFIWSWYWRIFCPWKDSRVDHDKWLFWRFVCYPQVNLLPVRWSWFKRKKIGITVTQHITKCNKHTFYLQLHFPSLIELTRLRYTSSCSSATGIKVPEESYLRDERFHLGQAKKGSQGARHNTLMIKSKESTDTYLISISF